MGGMLIEACSVMMDYYEDEDGRLMLRQST